MDRADTPFQWRYVSVSVLNASFRWLTKRYVAMHAMQDDHEDDKEPVEENRGRLFGVRKIGASLAGMFLPLLTLVGHNHGH